MCDLQRVHLLKLFDTFCQIAIQFVVPIYFSPTRLLLEVFTSGGREKILYYFDLIIIMK